MYVTIIFKLKLNNMKKVTLLDSLIEFPDNLDIINERYLVYDISLVEVIHEYMEAIEIDRADVLKYIDVHDSFATKLKQSIFNSYMADKLN